jgi:predicted PurR-regulated permease PerM
MAIAGPFLAPYAGSTFSFAQEVVSSAISLIIFVAILWFFLRRVDRDA